MHITFSFLNILLAALWGILIALSKSYYTLPTPFLSNLYAHIYLAAIGWVLLMVFGFSYRLIPMFLPGEPAKGIWPWISGILVESGIVGLFICLLVMPEFTPYAIITVAAGILIFILLTVRTVAKPKPIPPPLPKKPDFSILHVLSSFLWLVATILIGLILFYSDTTEQTQKLTIVYGFAGLVGSLSQIILGMRPKLLAIFTWYHVFTQQKSTENLPRPIDMSRRSLLRFTFILWTTAALIFAGAIFKNSQTGILIGSVAILISLCSSFLNEVLILKRIGSSSKINIKI
jgi:hypothetical protein